MREYCESVMRESGRKGGEEGLKGSGQQRSNGMNNSLFTCFLLLAELFIPVQWDNLNKN